MKCYLGNKIHWAHHTESVRRYFKDYYECYLELRYP
jgi:hypothetical protein